MAGQTNSKNQKITTINSLPLIHSTYLHSALPARGRSGQGRERERAEEARGPTPPQKTNTLSGLGEGSAAHLRPREAILASLNPERGRKPQVLR